MPHEADLIELLPDELREQLQRQREMEAQQIAFLTASLLQKRKKAIEGRQASGIEQEWLACEDAYEGIDDANRATEQPVAAGASKPRSHLGGAIGVTTKPSGTRSTVFLNITRPYCDAAAARVSDMLLPTDDRNFAFQPTPIPELDVASEDQSALPIELAEATSVATVAELAALKLEEAKTKAERAQTRVDDWLVECQYHAEARKAIEDCSRLGSGILKGPVPTRRKRVKVAQEGGAIAFGITHAIAPDTKRVDPWDLFPDPSCGENIHNGSYLFERDRLSAKQLRDLQGQPGYRDDEIDACLDEGPSKINVHSDGRRTEDDERFEAWYFVGQISEDELTLLNPTYNGSSGGKHIDVVCTMVNDRIIKAAPSHLDSGDFPYDLMPWQARVGLPFGIGVAKQISVPQRMLNAATRNLNDNAALSSAPQIIMKRGVVTPADGTFELTPRKVWFCDPNADERDVRMAFMAIEIPTRQGELMNIIQFALKMAEDVTGLPMLMQGNQGKAPDTVGGMTILNNNANAVLRRIARLFDDRFTEPHMRRYYEWIMLYGDESEKGDFTIDARGSTTLVERDIQQQALMAMGAIVKDPAYGIDPELWAQEMLKANKIDPKRVMLTEEKRKAQAEQRAALLAQQQELLKAQQAEKAADRESRERIEGAKIEAQREIAGDKTAIEAQRLGAEVALKTAVGSGI